MKNCFNDGVCSVSHEINRKSQGRTTSKVNADRLETFFQRNIEIQTATASSPMPRLSAARMPNRVETPLPPLNLRKTEYT